jgi:hypothetical protein
VLQGDTGRKTLGFQLIPGLKLLAPAKGKKLPRRTHLSLHAPILLFAGPKPNL